MVKGEVIVPQLPFDQVGGLPQPATSSSYSVAADQEESSKVLVNHESGIVFVWIAHLSRAVFEHPALIEASVGPKVTV